MAKQAKIETKLTGDATGLKRELNIAKTEVGRYAKDVTERIKAINVAIKSINFMGQIGLFISGVKFAIEKYKELRDWINGTSKSAQEAAEKAAEAGRRLADAAGKANLTPEQFAAVTDAAARANIPASELEKTLAAIAAQGGGIEAVAEAIGMTADELERAANVAGRNITGRKYAATAEERRKEAAESEAGREADRKGYMDMARDLLGASASEFARVVADVARATGGNEEELDRIASNLIMQTRGARGAFRAAFGMDRDVNRVIMQLSDAFAAERARRAAADEDAKRAWAMDVIGAGVNEWNPYEAHAEEERQAAAARAAEERTAAEAARRAARRGELLEQRESARVKREEDIAAITVSAPQAINSFNSIGGLVGADPTAQNVARMEAERNAKIEAINKKFDEANNKLQQALDALNEG